MDPAHAALTALAKLFDQSVLGWRPADPSPGMVVFHRPEPDRCMVVVIVDGWYAVVAGAPGGDQPPAPIAPIDVPREAAARIARAFGVAREPTPAAEREIAVSRVLNGTTCDFGDCVRPAVAAVVMACDWVEFRCLEHRPETHAGLARRGHRLTYCDSTDRADSADAGTGFG